MRRDRAVDMKQDGGQSTEEDCSGGAWAIRSAELIAGSRNLRKSRNKMAELLTEEPAITPGQVGELGGRSC